MDPQHSVNERIQRLEDAIERIGKALVGLIKSHRENSTLEARAATRLDAALRGVQLGRPPADSDDLDFDSDTGTSHTGTVFHDVNASDAGIDFDGYIVEAITMFITSERYAPAVSYSTETLMENCREAMLEFEDRPWPFASTKHFGRRLGMARDSLKREMIEAAPMRDSKSKRHWKIRRLTMDDLSGDAKLVIEPKSKSEPA